MFITTWVSLLLGPLSVQSLEVLIHVGILTHAYMHIFIITLSVWVYVIYLKVFIFKQIVCL